MYIQGASEQSDEFNIAITFILLNIFDFFFFFFITQHCNCNFKYKMKNNFYFLV